MGPTSTVNVKKRLPNRKYVTYIYIYSVDSVKKRLSSKESFKNYLSSIKAFDNV